MIDPNTLGGWMVALVAGGMATYERIKSSRVARKKEENLEVISDAKAFRERGDMMAKLAEEYRERLKREHEEYMAYRDWAHTKAGNDQSLLTECQNRLMELQAKPDLTDIFTHLKQQSDAIREILEITKALVQHLDQKAH